MKKNFKYLYSAGAVAMLLGAAIACTEEEPIYMAPEFKLNEASNIMRTTATFSGSISGDLSNIKEYGFQYSLSEDFTANLTENVVVGETPTSQFCEQMVSGLEANERYYYRMYATTGVTKVFSNLQYFQTAASSAPLISKFMIDSIGENLARFKFTVEDIGDEHLIEQGIGYKTLSDQAYIPIPTDSLIPTSVAGTSNTYFVEIFGLEPSTKYMFRPYAKNSSTADGSTGTREGYGEVLQETTESLLSADVTTSEIYDGDVGINSIDVTGILNSAKGSNDIVTTCGFCWSENNTLPVITDNKLELDPVRVGESFTATIKDLKPQTLYYVRAYATSIVGGAKRVGYGEVYEVTTGNLNTPKLEFETEMNDGGWTSLVYETTATSIHIKATITNYDANALVEKGLIWSETDGEIKLDVAKEKGTVLSLDLANGGKVIDGTIEGLEMNTRYFVRAFALYRADGLEVVGYTNAENLRTNNYEAPDLLQPEVKDVTTSSAILIGGFNRKGNGTIKEKGFVVISRDSTYLPELKTEGVMIVKSDDDTFTEQVTGLTFNKNYAVRTYAISELAEVVDTTYSWYSDIYTSDVERPEFKDWNLSWSIDTLKASAGLSKTGEGEIVERGFFWQELTNNMPAFDLEHCESIKAEGTNEEFSAAITGFKYSKSYRLSVYVKSEVDGAIAVYTNGIEHHFGTPDALEDIECVSSGLTSLTVKSKVREAGKGTIVEKGFIWLKDPLDGYWKNPNFESVENYTASKAVEETTNGEFTMKIEGLERNIGYYVRAYAKISCDGEEYYSYSNSRPYNTQDYTTPRFGNMNVPTDSIGFSTAVLATEFSDMGNVPVLKKGFVVHLAEKTSEPTIENKLYQLDVEGDDFQGKLTGLKYGTQYSVRAYVSCKVGEEEETVYSGNRHFWTNSPRSTTFNNIRHLSDSVTMNSLYFNCGIGEVRDGELIEKGFIWKKRPEGNGDWQYPSFEDNENDLNDGYTGYQAVEGDSIHDFSQKVTGLAAATRYYFRAYAKVKIDNSEFIYYSDVTWAETGSIQSVRIKDIEHVKSSLSSITVKSGINDMGTGSLKEKGFIWIKDPNDGYPKSPRFEDDPNHPNNDGCTGFKAVTDGTDDEFSMEITDLVKGSGYYICAYVKTEFEGVVYEYFSNTIHSSTENDQMPYFGSMVVESDSIGFSTAVLQSSFKSLGNRQILKKGFVVHLAETTNEPAVNNKLYQLDVEGDTMQAKLTGLKHNTRYSVRAFATCKVDEGEETVYSVNRTFTTDRPGNVRFNNLVHVGDSTTLNSLYYTCGIAEVPDGEVIEKGFIWKERPRNNHNWHEPSFEDHPDNESDGYTGYQAVESDSLQSYAIKITNLKPSTTYYVRSYAKVKVEEETYTFYSSTNGSGTSNLSVNLEFYPALDSCVVSGNVGDLPAGVEEFGICYALDTDINTPIEDMTTKVKAEKAADFDESGKFTASIGNLTSNEEYKVGFYFILNGVEIRLDGEWWFNTKRAPSINDNVSPGKQGDE